MDKRSLSERDICTKFITPALRRAGWDEMLQIREEAVLLESLNAAEAQIASLRNQLKAILAEALAR